VPLELPYDLAGSTLLLVALGALIVGFSKTSIGGMGTIATALFALALPTRESTGAVLLLLIVGDIVAVLSYRRDANWTLLRHLLPAMLPGLVIGTVILHVINDNSLRVWIGVLISVLVVLQLIMQWRQRGKELTLKHHPPLVSWLAGGSAGVATMTANAAGPITTLYLLSTGVDKRQFLGTAAWYYFIGNLIKVPFSAGIGLMPPATLLLTVMLAPVVLLGTLIGRLVIKRINQKLFSWLVLAGSALAAIALLAR